jgi:hypothetical protein
MSELERDIGRHDADIDNLKKNVEAIRTDLDDIKAILEQTRGGWRVLLSVATVAGAAGAGLAKFFSFKVGT